MIVRLVTEEEVARELLPDLKGWLARARSEISGQIQTIDKSDDLGCMGWYFLSKQLDHAEALFQLVPRKDTVLIARTMVEGLVQFLWASKDKARAHQWRAYSVIEEFNRIPQLEAQHRPPTPEMMVELRETLEEVGPLFFTKSAQRAHDDGEPLPARPYHRTWLGARTTREVFEDVDGGSLHAFFYGPYSAWAHWSSGSFGDRISETATTVTWSPVSATFSAEALTFAIMCILHTAGILFQHIRHENAELPGRLWCEFGEWQEMRLEELKRHFQGRRELNPAEGNAP